MSASKTSDVSNPVGDAVSVWDLAADSVSAGESFATDSATKPVPCASDRDLWFPDLEDAPKRRLRHFKRHTLPVIRRACGRCHFRIMCAVMALETQATDGVWAGVLVRDYSRPGTWHRKQLLALLAEFVAEALDKDPAEIDPQYEALCERITVMLQRQPELQPIFDAALADTLARTDTDTEELPHAGSAERNTSTGERRGSDRISPRDQLRLFDPVGIPA
jgi:hypothetical protein